MNVGRKVEIVRTCSNERHIDRARNDERQADAAARKAREELIDRVAVGIETALRRADVNLGVLRLLAFLLSRNDGRWRTWADFAAMDAALLVTDVTERLSAQWQLRDVDLDALLTDLNAPFVEDHSDAQVYGAHVEQGLPLDEAAEIATAEGYVREDPPVVPKKARAAEPGAAATLEADRGVDAPICSCGKPKVDAGHARWVCTNPDHSPAAATA